MNAAGHDPRRSFTGDRRRRNWLWLAWVLILLAGLALWLVPRRPTVLPPEIDTAGFDPAIAEAIRQARQGVLDSPRSAPAWGRMGMVLLAHELRDEAAACLREAEALDAKEARWPYFLGLAFLPDDPAAAVIPLGRAVGLLSQGDPRKTPGASTSRLRLADAWLMLGRTKEAETQYQTEWEENPGSAPAALGLGKVANAGNRPSEAVEFLSKAMADPTTRRSAHRLAIGIYQRLDRTQDVDQLAPVLARLPPDDALPDPFAAEIEALKVGENAWIDQADAWIKQGRPLEAAQLLEKTVQRYPRSDRALFFLGRARQRLGDFAQAESNLLRAIELSPGKIEAHMQLGILRLGVGRTEEAQGCFRAALQAKPNLAEGWYNLGLSLGAASRAESMAAFREAIRLKPDLVEAHLALSVVLRANGQREAAAEVLRHALTLRPDERLRDKLLAQLKALGPP